MSFYTPAQKRRFATERKEQIRRFDLANKLKIWQLAHPHEWELLRANRGKAPFIDSLYLGLTQWGSLTYRQINALQNYGLKTQYVRPMRQEI